jgi:predicted metal-dependent hydrolase
MGLFEEAYGRLYPGQEPGYSVAIKYSGKFKDYNANARMRRSEIMFSLSRKWKGVDDEIRIGLIQELLCSLLKDKRNTLNIELYNNFIKNMHLAVEKTAGEPMLEESFERVNLACFDGLVEKPNLKWGQPTKRTLGNYNYPTDMISMNPLLRKDLEALDYVMYHELLHKKLKFRHNLGRSYHHTAEFKLMERRFPNAEQIEKRLRKITSTHSFLDFF